MQISCIVFAVLVALGGALILPPIMVHKHLWTMKEAMSFGLGMLAFSILIGCSAAACKK